MFNMAVEVESNIVCWHFQPSPKSDHKVKMRNVYSRKRVVYKVSQVPPKSCAVKFIMLRGEVYGLSIL